MELKETVFFFFFQKRAGSRQTRRGKGKVLVWLVMFNQRWPYFQREAPCVLHAPGLPDLIDLQRNGSNMQNGHNFNIPLPQKKKKKKTDKGQSSIANVGTTCLQSALVVVWALSRIFDSRNQALQSIYVHVPCPSQTTSSWLKLSWMACCLRL